METFQSVLKLTDKHQFYYGNANGAFPFVNEAGVVVEKHTVDSVSDCCIFIAEPDALKKWDLKSTLAKKKSNPPPSGPTPGELLMQELLSIEEMLKR
ncbi:hypothetical protein GGF41_004897 [Coemansia sp. RSA 2531]|nr:hypothetical protein GGF41_004897 [Coemansia sp. RSA 2531]